MSTTNDDEVKPKQEPEKKIFYCEICKVPCMSSISLQSHFRGAKHKKKERAMNSFRAPAPVVYETPRPVKRKLTKDITCLKDFMKDPKREEPLVGLEHVVEIRFEGRKEPHYECKLCYFNTEMAPMIEHLCGYKHRRAYLSDKFPEKMKKNAQEDKVSFLRRVAREIEKTEGLKKYKTEGYTRPSIPSASSSKKKSRWEDDYKSENDPVQKQKALEYLETFRVTSDKEATLVVSITQELTEALKTFCKKKAAINYASSLRPLMSISQDEFSSGKNIQNPSKSYGTYKGNSGNTNRNQDFSSQRLEQAQFTSQLDANASNSFTTASSYSYQKGDGSSSYELRPNDSATVAPLNNAFALQTGGFATGISEWKKQFNQSASVNSQSTSVQGTSPYFTYSGSRYSTEYKSNSDQGNKTTAPDNRMAYGIGGTNWKSPGAFTNKKNLPDQRSSYSASSTYPASGGYSTNYPLQGCSSYYSGGSANSTSSSRGGSSWSEESRHQKSNFKTDSASFRSSSSVHNSYRDYQQNRESDKMFEDASALTPNVPHRSQGQDLPSMTRKLKQLTPYYPALQKINIEALVKVLIESREIRR